MARRIHRLISDMNAYETPHEVFSTLKEGYDLAVVFMDPETGELLGGPEYLPFGEKIPNGEGIAVILSKKIFQTDFEIEYATAWEEFQDDIALAFDEALKGDDEISV